MGINVTGNNIDPQQTTMTTVEYARDGSRGFIAGWGQEGINNALKELQVKLMWYREGYREDPINLTPLVPDVRVAWRNDRHPWNNR